MSDSTTTTERDYAGASDSQLVEWANEGDAEALAHAMGAVRAHSLDGDPGSACVIVGALSPSVLDAADAHALYDAGRAFDRAESYGEALKWFLKASEKGHVEAPFYAGVILEGRDDLDRAFLQYKLAADRGDRDGQYMTANYLCTGKGVKVNPQEALRYIELAAKQGQKQALKELDDYRMMASRSPSCVIATACIGDDRVAPLRRLRDQAISNDPIARDFFHVFWSRYYEWSPYVARLASQDRAVAGHIKWGFLDPWLAWLELAILVGRRSTAELTPEEQWQILDRLTERLEAWLSQLPGHLEGKCPSNPAKVFEAFERFREEAAVALAAMERARTANGGAS